jgi:serine/threonine-protein kinase RsbW
LVNSPPSLDAPVDAPVDAPTLALQLPAHMSSLEPARRAVLDFVAGHGLSERAVYRLELVLEETLTNVIRHAFPTGGEHRIDVALRVDADSVTLHLEDDGVAFDPVQATPRAPAKSIDESEPGGLGLVLTRKAARAWHYERVRGGNRLTLEIARA